MERINDCARVRRVATRERNKKEQGVASSLPSTLRPAFFAVHLGRSKTSRRHDVQESWMQAGRHPYCVGPEMVRPFLWEGDSGDSHADRIQGSKAGTRTSARTRDVAAVYRSRQTCLLVSCRATYRGRDTGASTAFRA